jgi:hypothetical protein
MGFTYPIHFYILLCSGNIPTNAFEIMIDDEIYISITEASRQLNIPTPTILWRLKSKNPKFYNYKYTKQPSSPLSVDDVDSYVSQNHQQDNH